MHGNSSARARAMMRRALLLLLPLLLLGAAAGSDQPSRKNVLFVCVDNLRPALGAYGDAAARTPHIDALAAEDGSTLFSRAYCNFAWCAPSRNSFLTGRRPDTTRAWNFLDSFRERGVGDSWITLPEYFKDHGYFTSSSGKIFHPRLPPHFDYPRSWSDVPYYPPKPHCPNATMTCEFDDRDPSAPRFFDADRSCANVAIRRLRRFVATRNSTQPFFLAVGFQSPRLPWSYPSSAAAAHPNATAVPVAVHRLSPVVLEGEELEWFRPTEVDQYTDVRNITHVKPLAVDMQHEVLRAYYAAITHVDTQFGRLIAELNALQLRQNTTIVFFSDHGQNLGEGNTWSMMNVKETSLRVPLIVHQPSANAAPARVVDHLVELVDLYPTLLRLAHLPAAPARWGLAGRNLAPYVEGNIPSSAPVKLQAMGQITRCKNCVEAYKGAHPAQCLFDARADVNYTVPCCKTPRSAFDWMGYSLRTRDWRYAVFCPWNGTALAPDWTACLLPELYSHRNDSQLYNVNDYENENLAGRPQYAALQTRLHHRTIYLFSHEMHTGVPVL